MSISIDAEAIAERSVAAKSLLDDAVSLLESYDPRDTNISTVMSEVSRLEQWYQKYGVLVFAQCEPPSSQDSLREKLSDIATKRNCDSLSTSFLSHKDERQIARLSELTKIYQELLSKVYYYPDDVKKLVPRKVIENRVAQIQKCLGDDKLIENDSASKVLLDQMRKLCDKASVVIKE